MSPVLSTIGSASIQNFRIGSSTVLGTLSFSNNSGSTISSMTKLVSIPLTASMGASGQYLKFLFNGKQCGHWVSKVVGSMAYVYVNFQNVPTGSQTAIVTGTFDNLSSTSGLFSAFTNFAGNVVGSGFEVWNASSNPEVSFSGGIATVSTAGGISFILTTANVGTDVCVDSDISPTTNSILEIGARFNKSDYTKGIKYRWDYRTGTPSYGNSFLNTPLNGWQLIQSEQNINMGSVGTYDIYGTRFLGTQFFSYRNNVVGSYSLNDSNVNYNQSGIAGIASHVSSFSTKWIAVYPNYNVTTPTYTSLIP